MLARRGFTGPEEIFEGQQGFFASVTRGPVEMAPLAGHYPALRLGPPWWFHDSIQGMTRFREQVTETAGIYNTAGFNDDTRAFCSIPARNASSSERFCSAANFLTSSVMLTSFVSPRISPCA